MPVVVIVSVPMIIMSMIIMSAIIMSAIIMSAIIVSVPMVFVFVFVSPLTLFPALSLHFAFALMLLIVALIFGLVFLRSHEVHRPIAGIVLSTVLTPIPGMIRRDVQINGRRRSVLRLDHDRLRVNDRRWAGVAEIDLTIHAGNNLARQHDADIHSACIARAGGQYR
jgi:hypothetical protein